MRRLPLFLWPAGAACGIAAEWALYGWADPRHWVPDLVTGWSLIACGLIGWWRRRESRIGALLAATGFAWFAPNFVGSVGTLDWLSTHALYLHRGPLVQAVLTYPGGRAVGRFQRSAVAAGYAAAIVTPLWRSGITTIVLAALLVGIATRGYLRAVGRDRRARLYALRATTFLAGVLAVSAAVRLGAPTVNVRDATLLLYQAGLCALAIGLLVGLLRAPWERPSVTNLVVELGEVRSGTLRDALARELGDPTLEVAYRLSSGVYVDASGRSLDLPRPDSDRRVTHVERDGHEVVALVHDPAVLDDPALLEAVAAAARLAGSNARLQAEVRRQVVELAASRRRLLEAGDEERRRLEQRLRAGAARRLGEVSQLLAAARVGASRELNEAIRRAEAQLERTLAELDELAAGLHPREVTEDGLAGALASLAERSATSVEVKVDCDRLRPDLEAAIFFVCSEALANVAKHASASRSSITIRATTGVAHIEIADDGVGGADPRRGSGLRGLADRIDALGGRFRVDSPSGRGTRLVAELPI